MRQWQWQWQVLALLGGMVSGAEGQIKLRVVEDPKVGRDAPDFTAAYVTANGPGPVDQPFHLRAELGRKVVLFFVGVRDSTVMRAEWQALLAKRDSLFRPGVVVAGVLRGTPGRAIALAVSLGLPFKLLPDSSGRAFQTYGVVGRQSHERWAVFVVDPLGKLVYRSREFLPTDAEEVRRLKEGLP